GSGSWLWIQQPPGCPILVSAATRTVKSTLDDGGRAEPAQPGDRLAILQLDQILDRVGRLAFDLDAEQVRRAPPPPDRDSVACQWLEGARGVVTLQRGGQRQRRRLALAQRQVRRRRQRPARLLI